MRPSLSFRSALLALVAISLIVGIIPTGFLLLHWVAGELEARAFRDANLAPTILEDRNRAISDALMMHAKDVAHTPGLSEALSRQDFSAGRQLAAESSRLLGHAAILVTADGRVLAGPRPTTDLISATRRGEMPVSVVSDSVGVWLVSVAAVELRGAWIGVAGVANPLDSAAAAVLANLTRSDLVAFLAPSAAPVLSRSGDTYSSLATSLADAPADEVRSVRLGSERFIVSTGPLAGARVAFVRDMRPVLAIVPQLRGALIVGGVGVLLIALLLSSRLALLIVAPVRGVAEAADKLSQGDFSTELKTTRIREMERVSHAFQTMRTALARRIDELRAANRMLEDRQVRLSALQTELISRERVATSGRIVAELAHEIRNPVASLRNCLELLHRRLASDPQGQEYAALAIDELLRMHELAERMLHLNRPRHAGADSCDAADVVREVASLAQLASRGGAVRIDVHTAGHCRAAIPADALKQVLLNLVQNAKEAAHHDLRMNISVTTGAERLLIVVRDNGPGVPVELRDRIFDPFFTTREGAGGVGLGLFVVEGLVRGFGGTVSLVDDGGGPGACFRMELPLAPRVQPALQSRATAGREA